MVFLPSMSPADMRDYHQVVSRWANMRSHFDLLVWLQGDLQRYLPHQILIAAWGSFSTGEVQYDVLSPIPGVRSHTTKAMNLIPMLQRLFERWQAFDHKPFALNVGHEGFIFSKENAGEHCNLGNALHNMRSVAIHGINDARGSHDCLYLAFSDSTQSVETHSAAMAMLLPYIDMALRQVEHLPMQLLSPHSAERDGIASPAQSAQEALSSRETEILNWVAMGKTNADIGMILGISEFTVKNHLQRVFKKLDVSNRAQAVSRLNTLLADA
jgi:transcriptional regulator EpsA